MSAKWKVRACEERGGKGGGENSKFLNSKILEGRRDSRLGRRKEDPVGRKVKVATVHGRSRMKHGAHGFR